MKIFYKVPPEVYKEMMEKARIKFKLHKDVDEEKIILSPFSESVIEQVRASYTPGEDDMAQIRIVITDESLKAQFDEIFGEPYKVK